MNNEEKIYDLLEKVYLELQDTKTELQNTKDEVGLVRSELKEEMSSVRSELKEEIGSVRSELKEEIGSVRSELKEEIGSVHSELYKFRTETNTRFDTLENKLDDAEANNANRHIVMNKDLENIKYSLDKLEIVTADNWSDITRLKIKEKKKAK